MPHGAITGRTSRATSRGRGGYSGDQKMINPGRSPVLRYGVAVLSVAVVTLLRLVLRALLGGSSAFLPDEVAVMFSSWYGGLRPGLLATALSAFASSYLFLPPVGSMSIAHP